MYDSIIFTDLTEAFSVAKPIGAYKCAQVLRENGYSCLVVDNFSAFSEQELKDVLKLSVGDNTKFIGFSTTFLAKKIPDDDHSEIDVELPNKSIFPHGKDIEDSIIRYTRSLNPNIRIVAGGAKASSMSSNKNIDVIIIGYGETSIVNLMNHLAQGSELVKSFKNVWGQYVVDDQKAPGYDFANSHMDWLPEDVVNHTMLPFEVGRGCIFNCSFCSYPLNGKKKLDFIRNTDRLVYELEKNYEQYGIYRYTIVDDTFNDNDYKLDSLLQGVKKLKFQPEFWAYARLDLIARNAETNIQKLYDIGLRAAFFGIETLNDATGRRINKGGNRQKQIETIQYIRNKFGDNISLTGGFIVGLPGESEDSVRNTGRMLATQELPLHAWQFTGLSLVKNSIWKSPIELDYQKYGYQLDPDAPDFFTFVGNHSTHCVKWKNEHMNFEKAWTIARDIMIETSHVNSALNTLTWEFQPLGYDFKSLVRTSMVDIPWYDIKLKRREFVKEYKAQLFKLLSNG